MNCPKCGTTMEEKEGSGTQIYTCDACDLSLNLNKEHEEVVTEVLTVGRELSGKTFSGKPLDYNIPKFDDKFMRLPSIRPVKKALLESLQDYDDVALLLSGGKDSRMLACLLKELGKEVTCYTYIMRHNTYEENELKASKRVARALNYKHRTIDINFKNYYNPKLIEKIMKITDGVPLFHSLLTLCTIRPYIEQKHVITGNLITELLDTSEYRPWKDGKDVKRFLFNQERFSSFETYCETRFKLLKIYGDTPLNELLLLRKSDRIIRERVYDTLNFGVVRPALDKQVLQTAFTLPLNYRTDGYIPRNIIRITNRNLYKLPTARSPFSLRVPLSFHIAYAKLFGQSIDNTPIPGAFNDTLLNLPKIEKYRLDNVLWWQHVNKKS